MAKILSNSSSTAWTSSNDSKPVIERINRSPAAPSPAAQQKEMSLRKGEFAP